MGGGGWFDIFGGGGGGWFDIVGGGAHSGREIKPLHGDEETRDPGSLYELSSDESTPFFSLEREELQYL